MEKFNSAARFLLTGKVSSTFRDLVIFLSITSLTYIFEVIDVCGEENLSEYFDQSLHRTSFFRRLNFLIIEKFHVTCSLNSSPLNRVLA